MCLCASNNKDHCVFVVMSLNLELIAIMNNPVSRAEFIDQICQRPLGSLSLLFSDNNSFRSAIVTFVGSALGHAHAPAQVSVPAHAQAQVSVCTPASLCVKSEHTSFQYTTPKLFNDEGVPADFSIPSNYAFSWSSGLPHASTVNCGAFATSHVSSFTFILENVPGLESEFLTRAEPGVYEFRYKGNSAKISSEMVFVNNADKTSYRLSLEGKAGLIEKGFACIYGSYENLRNRYFPILSDKFTHETFDSETYQYSSTHTYVFGSGAAKGIRHLDWHSRPTPNPKLFETIHVIQRTYSLVCGNRTVYTHTHVLRRDT